MRRRRGRPASARARSAPRPAAAHGERRVRQVREVELGKDASKRPATAPERGWAAVPRRIVASCGSATAPPEYRLQLAVELGELRAQVELPGEHAQREIALGPAPGEVRPAVAGQPARERAQVRVRWRVDGDDVLEAGRQIGRLSSGARQVTSKPPTRSRERRRALPACAATAGPGRRSQRDRRAARDAAAAGVEQRAALGHAQAVADPAQVVVDLRLSGGQGVSRSRRARRTARSSSGLPHDSIGRGRAGCACRRTSRGSTEPL